MSGLRAKATKKQPLSFERLCIIVMPVFKLLEQKKQDINKATSSLKNWLKFIESQQHLSLNTVFESMLNLYLVLDINTVMKALSFVQMTQFLLSVG